MEITLTLRFVCTVTFAASMSIANAGTVIRRQLHLTGVSPSPTCPNPTTCKVTDLAVIVMNSSRISLVPVAQPDNNRSTSQPEMFRHTFKCGHPEEFIEARRDDDGDQVHNLITFEVFGKCSRRFGNLPAYLQARCLNCAKVAKEQDDKDPKVRPKRTLGTCQAAAPSTIARKAEDISLTGFDSVLDRYHRCDERNTAVHRHRRVSENEHQAHRLEMQVKAVECAGKWLAVPTRRVWNMPIRTTVAARPANRQQDTTHERNEETDRGTEPEDYTGKGAVEVMESLAEISPRQVPEGNDKSFRMAAVNIISLSGSKLERQKKSLGAIAKPLKLGSTVTNSDGALLDHATEAHRPQDVPEVALPGRGSAFVEDLNDQHGPPFNDWSNSPLTNQEFEYPRPAPIVPPTAVVQNKGALDFKKRGSSTSIRRSTKSGPISTNFRKLGIDVHSTRFIKKTELDSNSPDWACRTSLAIEAGKISMDSVSKQSWESMDSKHIAEAMRSPEERRNTYHSPSGERNPASPPYARRSEGAPQASRTSATQDLGRLAVMEIVSMGKVSSKHDSAQVAPAMDLNKTLPALPLQRSEEEEET